MNFLEAIEALREGKKVRNSFMCHYYYFYNFDSKEINIDTTAGNACTLEWEIVEEDLKLHTFEEAFKAFKAGKTINRNSIVYKYFGVVDEDSVFYLEDMIADDWIITD